MANDYASTDLAPQSALQWLIGVNVQCPMVIGQPNIPTEPQSPIPISHSIAGIIRPRVLNRLYLFYFKNIT